MNTALTFAKMANSTTFLRICITLGPKTSTENDTSLSPSLFPIDLKRRADFFHSKKMWMRVVWEIGIVSLLFLSLPPPTVFGLFPLLLFSFSPMRCAYPLVGGWMGTLPAIASCRMTFVQNFEFSQKERQTDRGGGERKGKKKKNPFLSYLNMGKNLEQHIHLGFGINGSDTTQFLFLSPLFICEIGSFSSSFSLVNPPKGEGW